METAGRLNYTILYFLDCGKGFGGAANTLIQQAALMKSSGCRTVIFFSDYRGRKLSDEYKAVCADTEFEYEWATYRISSQTEDIDLVCIDKNYEAFRDVVLSYKPDILHSIQINPCVELISRELGIPHIMNIYPLIPAFFTIDYMDIFAHYHLCDSWYYAHKWQHYLHTDSMCIRTAVSKRIKREKNFCKLIINYICAGSVYEEKNQLTVIKAFHKALSQGIAGKLTICGYLVGSYGNACVQYVKDHKLQDHIIFKGYCLDMIAEYDQSDVLICGSTRESYPNVISEAMANGLVVISTPVGGVPEVITDGENGYLAKDYTVDALTEKILEIQRDIESGKIEKIVAGTEETFEKNHSCEAVAGQLGEYYRYVLNDHEQMKQVYKDKANIHMVRNVFRHLLNAFADSEECFTDIRVVSRKLWYLYYVKDKIIKLFTENRELYIWGAGNNGIAVKEMTEVFLPEVRITGFLDSQKKGEFLGYSVFLPDEIIKKENIVILVAAINGQHEMVKKLEDNNMLYNQDYFILSERRW